MIDFTHAPLIMGIVNVTPDSFSGDGLMKRPDHIDAAIGQALRMCEEGAHILDIGGESTKPGSTPVGIDEEIARVVPVIKGIRDSFRDIPISIDTMKSAVAEAAIQAGASIINDVTALQFDPAIACVAVKHAAALILMHNRSNSLAVAMDHKIGGEYRAAGCKDIVADVRIELHERAVIAEAAGVPIHDIILDPGIGFGKTVEQNLTLINRLDQLKSLGYRLLVGASRKSFIGRVLDVPVEERLEGTAAAVAIAIARGADIVRVHDVRFMSRVVAMTTAICKT